MGGAATRIATRVIGAVLFSVGIGWSLHLRSLEKKEHQERQEALEQLNKSLGVIRTSFEEIAAIVDRHGEVLGEMSNDMVRLAKAIAPAELQS